MMSLELLDLIASYPSGVSAVTKNPSNKHLSRLYHFLQGVRHGKLNGQTILLAPPPLPHPRTRIPESRTTTSHTATTSRYQQRYLPPLPAPNPVLRLPDPDPPQTHHHRPLRPVRHPRHLQPLPTHPQQQHFLMRTLTGYLTTFTHRPSSADDSRVSSLKTSF